MSPDTHDARAGDAHLANRVSAEGPVDAIRAPRSRSHPEDHWRKSGLARWRDRPGRSGRAVTFYRRGAGWKTALIAALGLTITPALAGGPDGFYVEGRGGISVGTDSDIVADPGDPPPSPFTSAILEFNFEPHGVAEVILGYRHRSGFRVELDAGYREAGVGRVNILDAGGREAMFGLPSILGDASNVGVGFSGTARTLSGLVNVLYGFDLRPVTPFIGGGIGAARVTADITEVGHTGIVTELTEGSDTVLAYQGIAGVEAALSESISFTVSYAYFDTEDPDFFKRVAGGKFVREFDISSHNLMVGLRYNF